MLPNPLSNGTTVAPLGRKTLSLPLSPTSTTPASLIYPPSWSCGIFGMLILDMLMPNSLPASPGIIFPSQSGTLNPILLRAFIILFIPDSTLLSNLFINPIIPFIGLFNPSFI
ncbi:hypothetical protein ES703_50206 [subsurface metagenome]